VGLLGGARSHSIGTEGAEALPRWDPPASCPRWLSNTTCGAPSSRQARGTARMRVPSSSLTLRSGAPVRTRRGSGFEPLISRAVRGGAWAAPSLRLRPSRGLGELVLEVLVSSTAWHGCLWYLSCFRWAPGRPFHARGSRRSRVLRGMGARGARFASDGPRGDLLTPMSLRGLTPSRARGSHRLRVPRGMGARDACFVSSGPRGDLLTLVPLRGLNLSRARSPFRSRVLLALQGIGPLNAPQ
jgi:hypothetical protein